MFIIKSINFSQRKEWITDLLLLFKTIFEIFWLFWSETPSFPLYAPIEWKRRSLVIIDGKLFIIKLISVSQRKEWITYLLLLFKTIFVIFWLFWSEPNLKKHFNWDRLRTPHSVLRTLHSVFRTPYSALRLFHHAITTSNHEYVWPQITI